MGINTMRRSEDKKARFSITNVSLKDDPKIIKDSGNLNYEGYVRKRSKHVPTDSYFYLARQLAKCMIRFNSDVGPVRTKMTSMQKIPNS